MLDPRAQLEEGLRFQKNGLLTKALQHYESTVAVARDPAVVAEALCRTADLFRVWSKWEQAVAAAQRSADVARTANLDALYAEALNAEAGVYQERGEFDAAVPLLERVLEVTGDQRMRGIAYQNLGSIAAQRADLASAEQFFRKSLRCFRRSGYQWGEAFALNNCSAAAILRGSFKEAEVLGEHAMAAAQKIGDFELLGIAALNSAEAFAGQGALAVAEGLARASLDYFTIAENDLHRVQALRVLGDITMRQGDPPAAERHYAGALQLAEKTGSELEISRLRDCIQAAQRGR